MVYLTIQNCEQFIDEKVVCLNIINRSDFFDTTCHLGDIVIGYEHAAKLKPASDVSVREVREGSSL